ncbi:MAG: signal peptidase I [Ruminococcus sp.]|nr:signal peptidase I [Ruminococcus sp.]
MGKAKKRSAAYKAVDAVMEWAETIATSVLSAVLILVFFFRITVVQGSSMENTLYDNDKLIVRTFLYEPVQNDVVIINSSRLGESIVKRVIAVGGQQVVIDYNSGTVTVDGSIMHEPFIKNGMMNDTGRFDRQFLSASGKLYIYEVPQGQVFVMGDNRDVSADSRTIGFVPEEEIVGKAVFRLYSDRAYMGTVD